jgi:hypothetical protein
MKVLSRFRNLMVIALMGTSVAAAVLMFEGNPSRKENEP